MFLLLDLCMYVQKWSWWREGKWSEVMFLGEMCILSLIYRYVAVSRFCAVRCFIIICFYLGFLFTWLNDFYYYFCVGFLFYIFVFLIFIVFVLFCVLFLLFVYSCLFPIFVQVYRPLPPGGNPTSVNKYHIMYHISYHIIPHLISYIMSYTECLKTHVTDFFWVFPTLT
jgi:hypothetical protein